MITIATSTVCHILSFKTKNFNKHADTYCCLPDAAPVLQVTPATAFTATTWTSASTTTAAAASVPGSTASTPRGHGGVGLVHRGTRATEFSVLSWDRSVHVNICLVKRTILRIVTLHLNFHHREYLHTGVCKVSRLFYLFVTN